MRLLEIAAIAVAVAACAFDVSRQRIPNALTFGAAAAALITAAVIGGVSGFGVSAAGWLTGLVLFLPVYAVGGMGGGDVKLLAALGAWLGPATIFHAALYTAIAGAVLAIIIMVAKQCVRQTLSNINMMLLHWRVAGLTAPPLTLETSTSPKLAYAVPMLIGTVIALWLE
ncbi:MAG: peptidase A24 [Acidobacteria bacterium]|nr:MAG: peptidase A24 [Acidobacteriota bacterium]